MSEAFLSRWTRRKHAVRKAELTERPIGPEGGLQPVAPVEGEGAPAPVEVQPASAAMVPDPEGQDLLADLPSLEALTAETNLAPFLRAGVPAVLRNAALRRMWSMDPAIRDFVSEAREYAYDWNSPGGVPGLGPLLPSDDVEALLRRIVGGVPNVEPVTETKPDPSDVGEPSLPSISADKTGTDGVANEGESQISIAAIPESPSDTVPVVESPKLDPSLLRAPSESSSTSGPRLRRHGGAIPVSYEEIGVAADKNPS